MLCVYHMGYVPLPQAERLFIYELKTWVRSLFIESQRLENN